jgi:hypothetical protein
VAASTTELLHPKQALPLQLWVIQIGSLGIRGITSLQREQIAGNVLGFLPGQTQIGHDRHLLDLQFVSVIRAFGMIEIKDIR